MKLAILRYEAKRDAEALARKAMWARSTAGSSEVPLVSLTVRRDHLVQDSLRGISENLGDLRKELRIKFSGEDGIDAGGLRREWFTSIVTQLFADGLDLWTRDEDSGLCWPNPLCTDVDEFQLVGVLCGLAAKHGTPIDVPLASAVYKKLLGRPLGLADLRVWQPSLARGLQLLLDFDGDVDATFCRTFVYETTNYGQLFRAELKPDGEQIAVTKDNRGEYVELYIAYAFESASKQLSAFKSGFLHVLRGNALSLFQPEELEMAVRGSDAPIDIAALKLSTVFKGCSDAFIALFWSWMETASEQRRRDFVKFVTASGRLPATGYLALRIDANGEDQRRLPIAHTCFNQLVTPIYTTFDALERAFTTALDESQGFELR